MRVEILQSPSAIQTGTTSRTFRQTNTHTYTHTQRSIILLVMWRGHLQAFSDKPSQLLISQCYMALTGGQKTPNKSTADVNHQLVMCSCGRGLSVNHNSDLCAAVGVMLMILSSLMSAWNCFLICVFLHMSTDMLEQLLELFPSYNAVLFHMKVPHYTWCSEAW